MIRKRLKETIIYASIEKKPRVLNAFDACDNTRDEYRRISDHRPSRLQHEVWLVRELLEFLHYAPGNFFERYFFAGRGICARIATTNIENLDLNADLGEMTDDGNKASYRRSPRLRITRLRTYMKTDSIMLKSKLARADEQRDYIFVYGAEFFRKTVNTPRVIHRNADVHACFWSDCGYLIQFGK